MTDNCLTIVKVGGKIVEDAVNLERFLVDFANILGAKVLIHGGGRSATKLATQLGIKSQMIDGRRVTNSEMLKVVTMVYGGLVNKQIVVALQAQRINALGLTGADLNYMRSEKRPTTPIDYGFVGDVKEVDAEILAELIAKNIVPVLAPITHDKCGNLLNTNADTIAAETAKALAKFFDVRLIYCFEKKGVLYDENDEESVIEHITPTLFEKYVAEKIISGGMIPKLENAFSSLQSGVKQVIITSADMIVNGGTLISLC